MAPMRAVPWRWFIYKPTRMPIAIGTTHGSKTEVSTLRPSTALNTEIAGVIIASANSSEAPTRPSTTNTGRVAADFRELPTTSAISASMPPSPRLSARKMMQTYSMEMTRISAQTISDSTPRTFSCVAGMR